MWLLLSPFLSALLLAARIYQITQQWIHFKPPNLLLPLKTTVQQTIKTAKPLTTRPQIISVTTLLTAPLSLPPHPTTHTHAQLCSHTSSSNLKIHLSLPGHSTSEPQLNHISRHMHASPHFSRTFPVHTLAEFPPAAHGHAGQNKATSFQLNTPPIGLVPCGCSENLGILCPCLSQLLARWGGVRRKWPVVWMT